MATQGDWSTFGLVFTLLGAVCFLAAMVPPFLDVYKMNKTFGLSEKFMKFGTIAGFLFIITTIILIYTGFASGNTQMVCLGFVMFICNTISTLFNAYSYQKKMSNMQAAEAAGMTEMEYYYAVIEKQHTQSTSSQSKEEV